MNNRILFFIKTPPPLTGATLMNQVVNKSLLLRNNFEIKAIEISYVKNANELGGFSILKIGLFAKYLFKLLNELISFRPGLIYFQLSPLGTAFIRDFIYVLFMKMFKTKIVFHVYGKGIEQKAQKSIYRRLYKIAFNNQHLICLSDLLVYDIKSVYTSKPYIVPNAIEISNYLANHQNTIPKIIFVSNLFKSKGVFILLDALNLLNIKQVNFEANIVGKEGDISFATLKMKIGEYNLSKRVIISGYLDKEQKMQAFANSDLCVFPTLNDTWGLVILEAMQVGLPVIASDEGAIPEIIDDSKTGFVVEKNNAQILADKIEFLINNSETAINMGKEGRKKFLDKYSLPHFEENLRKVFSDILEKTNK
jgi:glycosyltransferase involved in cell wall biosynthesis